MVTGKYVYSGYVPEALQQPSPTEPREGGPMVARLCRGAAAANKAVGYLTSLTKTWMRNV